MTNLWENTRYEREDIERWYTRHQPHQDTGGGTGYQTKDDDRFPAKFICERTTDHAAYQAAGGPNAKYEADLCHAHIEFLGNVEWKEWENDATAKAVDEGCKYQDPERFGEG